MGHTASQDVLTLSLKTQAVFSITHFKLMLKTSSLFLKLYMYVYVCICMYMYVYLCICMYMYVYVCLCMYMYVYVCTWLQKKV